MKNKLLLVGGLIVAGATLYALYKSVCSNRVAIKNAQKIENEPSREMNHTIPEAERAVTTPTDDVEEVKRTVIQTVEERHYTAANVIGDALETVYGESIVETENDQLFDSIDNDLEDLLK